MRLYRVQLLETIRPFYGQIFSVDSTRNPDNNLRLMKSHVPIVSWILGLLLLNLPGAGAAINNLVTNGGFESDLNGWTTSIWGDSLSVGAFTSTAQAFSGLKYGYLGDYDPSHSDAGGNLKQQFQFPANATAVEVDFWLSIESTDSKSPAGDHMQAGLDIDGYNPILGEWSAADKTTGWVKETFQLDVIKTAGKSATLWFVVGTDSSGRTVFRIDDVAVNVTIPDSRYLLTVITEPATSGTVDENPPPNADGKYPGGTTVSLKPNGGTGYDFIGWQFTSGSGDVTYSLNEALVTMRSDRSVTAQFKPKLFSISGSNGNNGTINPNGTFKYVYGGTVVFNATPADGYEIDSWMTNGIVAQVGASTFTLNVSGDTQVGVTFRPKMYSLTTTAEHGTISVDPAMNSYPHGGSVTIRARPDDGYTFAQWTGAAQGFSPEIHLTMTGNLSLSVLFIKTQPTTFSMAIANSTPSGGNALEVKIDLNPGYRYVLFESDGLDFWRPLTAKDGNNADSIIQTFADNHSKPRAFYKVQRFLSYSTGTFLLFPIKNVALKDAVVTSILDHHGPQGLGKGDGAIVTCRGQLFTILNGPAMGYRDAKSTTLEVVNDDTSSPNYYKLFSVVAYSASPNELSSLPFAYSDQNNLLFYDGHAGYDYRATSSTEVIAAAEGDLVVSECGGSNNQLVLTHKDASYKTYYLHLSLWDDQLTQAVAQSNPIHIFVGQRLGLAGNVGASTSVHLHFQVERLASDSKFVNVDPYGYFAADGSVIEPPLWIESSH